jgi:antirestriction protein ArdC
MKTKDVIEKCANDLLSLMEIHDTNWTKPWSEQYGRFGRFYNPFTKNSYHGINVFILGMETKDSGYNSNEWGTFKNWSDAGYSIKKGEKATNVLFGKPVIQESKSEFDDKGDPLSYNYFCNKSYKIFNADQIDGYESENKPKVKEQKSDIERIEDVEKFVQNTGANIYHGGNRAYYTPTFDEIHMPESSQFKKTGKTTAQENYYAVLLHELTHWTGHKSRLNRLKSKAFGDNAYAFEELIAESGSAMLCTTLGIMSEPRPDHAKYLNNWKQGIKDNPKSIMSAFSSATKVVDYLENLQNKKESVA